MATLASISERMAVNLNSATEITALLENTLNLLKNNNSENKPQKGEPKMKPIKPGAKVTDSGIYKESGTTRRATMTKGEPAPPTTKPGHTWKMVVDTNPPKKSK